MSQQFESKSASTRPERAQADVTMKTEKRSFFFSFLSISICVGPFRGDVCGSEQERSGAGEESSEETETPRGEPEPPLLPRISDRRRGNSSS